MGYGAFGPHRRPRPRPMRDARCTAASLPLPLGSGVAVSWWEGVPMQAKHKNTGRWKQRWKREFAPSAAAASSPRIQSTHQERKMGVARPQTKGTRAVAMSHDASIKSCRPRSPVLNEKMTGFSHIGSPQPCQAERKAMAHERTRTKFSAQLRSDVMDAMYAAANAIFCMRNCNCNCAALLRLP